ncbi:MAG TPA: MerR family transcriptional regulator [Candidatus Binatia bacterium]|nr:MerR family transcriptional regulator [Candidatus Binatia bacterium]
METRGGDLKMVKEFAAAAGVTVRTLHLYDRIGLLKPAALSDSGYRRYGKAELGRLEQILALRFLGFSLDQIKELLGGSSPPLVAALQMQRELIARRKEKLESALAAIDEARRVLLRGEPADFWATLRNVIEVFKVQNDWEWTKKFYSEEAREKLEELQRNAPELVEQGQRAWAALLAEVEAAAARAVDPGSDEARELAARWRALLEAFTQGNAEIVRGLSRLWSDSANWPSEFARPWSDAADAFIKKAMER